MMLAGVARAAVIVRRKRAGGPASSVRTVYKYLFAVGNETRTYTSRIERQSQSGPCPVGDLFLQTYDAGQTVDCWRARTAEVSSAYQCGNKPDCFKIFDPAEDAKETAESGVLLMIGGAVVIGMLVVFVPCVYLL